MTQNSIIFRGGYDKGYKLFIKKWKFFCLYPNLFVCILIFYNKSIYFQRITKKYKNYKVNFLKNTSFINLWIGQ